MPNPAEIPFTIENLTVLEEQYSFATRRKGKKANTEPLLIYRLARDLKHYKLQDALAEGVKQEPGFVQRVKRKG